MSMNDKKKELENKILKNQEKIKKLNKEIYKYTSLSQNERRKKRAHKLIKLGVIFEMLNLDNEDTDYLIGYLLDYKKLNMLDKEKYKEKATIYIEMKQSIKSITRENILELLKLYNENDLDLIKIIREKYDKTSLESLNSLEYEELKIINNFK